MKKNRSFREFLALCLNQDYKFPLIEVFLFLFILLICTSVNTSFMATTGTEYDAYNLIVQSSGLSIFIYVILVSKNIAFGLGSDLEKGTMKTYFSYPIKRREILTSKLFSGIALTSIIFFAANFISLYIIAPNIMISNIDAVLVTYASIFAFVLLISSLVTLTSLTSKKGSLTLIVGVILFVAISIIPSICSTVAIANNTSTPLEILSYINPQIPLQYYYPLQYYSQYSMSTPIWSPSFNQIITFIAGNFAISAVLLGFSYYYFDRRMNL